MRDGIDIIAPYWQDGACNETEVFGATSWLWLQSVTHRNLPVHMLGATVLPAIKHQQFLIAIQYGKPIAYVSWANFSEETESRYVCHTSEQMRDEDWNSGDRLWIIDWFTPFGHSIALHGLVKRRLFANRCFRGLYHRGAEKGLRILQWHGIAVLPEEAQFWFDAHPVQTGV